MIGCYYWDALIKDSDTKSKGQVVIPYIKGTSEALRRIYAKYGIRTYIKPTQTFRQLLVSPKDKTEKKDVVGPVYLIPCQGQTSRGQCKESYIGESERSVKTRFLEHKRRSSTKSEVSQHIYIESPGHTVDLDKVKILDKDDRWFERGVKEAIYIRAYKPSLNKDGGRYRLPRVYDPLLTSLPPTSVNQSRQIQPASADERWCNSPENSRYLYFLWVDQEFKFSIYLITTTDELSC